MSTSNTSKFGTMFYDNMKHLQQKLEKPDYSLTQHLKKIAQTYDAIENRPTYILDLYTSDFFFVSERYLHLLGYNASMPLDFTF